MDRIKALINRRVELPVWKKFCDWLIGLLRNFLLKIQKMGWKQSLALGVFLILFISWLFCLPKPLFAPPYSTVVTDANGALLGARLADDGQWRFPVSDSVPYKMERCIVMFEDQYFWMHPGVNPVSIFRAIRQNISAGHVVSGGSTLSMQVIRSCRGHQVRSFSEKFIEMVMALRLELGYSKSEILKLYLDNAPFGGNTVGVRSASWRYFGRSCDNLSWAEAALLAVLPNAPSLIHPGKNRQMLLEKRNRLLTKLKNEGVIDEETCELAISEPLPEKPQSLQFAAPHLVDRMRLKKSNKVIRSTIDISLQKRMESKVASFKSIYTQNQVQNMALLVADTRTGNVLVYCGNADYNQEDNNHVDIITASRSTGSTLKPFLFNAMIEDGELVPTMLLPDIPIQIAGYRPNNYERKFDGAVPANEALARSLNIPAVLMLRDYGIPRFMDYLKKLGMTTLNYSAEHYGLTLILGGAEGNLWEITGAYASMARTLLRYTDSQTYAEGDIHSLRLEDRPEEKAKLRNEPVLFHAQAVWQTMNAIKELNRPDVNWRLFSSSKLVAWKTGTSFGNKDAWAIGVTPEYTVGVWVGNADGEGRAGLTGISYAAPVLFSVFNQLPATTWFREPAGMQEIEVCAQSGFKKGVNCPESKMVKIYEPQQEAQACPYHKIVHLTKDEQYRVNSTCMSVSEMAHVSWFVLPPSMEWYYKKHSISYRELPPFLPDCNPDENTIPMEFIYPKESGKLFIPKDYDGKRSEIVFEVAHRNKAAVLYWHLDNVYLGETSQFHQKGIDAEAGAHVVTVADADGNMITKKFEIVE
ncbi:MAG: penicillin-binding protein 1C [Paludibacteraceae bacterium]|nr:penicillin-binding protein 1C [Paludibacteraceae bacterium]